MYNESKFNFKDKKQLYKLGIIALSVVVVIAAVFGVTQAMKKDPKTGDNNDTSDNSKDTPGNNGDTNPTNNPTKAPVYIDSPINGVKIEESKFNSIKNRPVLAVVIQNNPISRPQAGLNEADIVYETLTESGITRFLGIYWSTDASRLQSIRSLRKYVAESSGDFKTAVIMHIGYSDGADNISAIKFMNRVGIKTLSNYPGTNVWDNNCINQKQGAREHCAYMDTKYLWDAAQKQGWNADVTTNTSWKFKDVSEENKFTGKDLTDFTVNFGVPAPNDYSVRWKYDAATNKYMRNNANGTPFNDAAGKQMSTDSVIFQKITSYGTGDSKGHQYQEVIGNGTGYVMQNGKVFNITWEKPNYTTRTKFYDATTKEEFVFNRGKIWIQQVAKNLEYVNNTPAAAN